MRTTSLTGGVLLAVFLTIAIGGCGGGSPCADPRTCAGYSNRVDDLPPVTATPEWNVPETKVVSSAETTELVEVHLDISSPMAGYLPPNGDGDLSVFRLVTQNAAQHMARVFGSADVPVKWVGVGHELRNLRARPQLERGVFNGRSTQIDRSIARMLTDFSTGRAEAAVLVSDLMATADGVTGPVALLAALREWLESADVRSGRFHVGLFGVKADYWGVRARGCEARAPLGCRFDELNRQWVVLETVKQIPVYALVLGRGAARVISVMESLQATVDELNRGRTSLVEAQQDTVDELNPGRTSTIEAQWELLTGARLGHVATVSCRAGTRGVDEPGPQYALYGNDQQQHCCLRDDTVALFCDVEGGFQPTGARATWVMTPQADGTTTAVQTANGDGAGQVHNPASPPDPDTRIEGARITFDFACSEFRCAMPTAGLELHLEGAVTGDDWHKDWSAWSTETNEVGRTLQLQHFVEGVRKNPNRYRMHTPALVRFSGR